MYLRIARLRYLPRLILHAPTVLLRFLDANQKTDGSWHKLITEDLDWLYEHLDEKQRPTKTVDLADITKMSRTHAPSEPN